MKAYVYTDKGLERYAGRFVWLSINTEEAKNAAFLKRHPIAALPTTLVIDAKRNTIVARFVGGATVAQVQALLDDAERTYAGKARSAADRLLAAADRASSEGKYGAAAKSYLEAIGTAPKKWTSFGRAAESLLFALSMDHAAEACASRAVELYPRLGGTSAAANVAATGLLCAASLEREHPKRLAMIGALESATREVLNDAKITLADDDRSGLYLALIGARESIGDDEEVLALHAQWAAFLEGAAARATTAEQRAVYDSHRLTAYLQLGIPERAIAMLEQSERDLPDDYNPAARLALAHRAMEQYDEALAASDRALARVSGPRRLVVLSNRADIFVSLGDPKAARDTLAEAIGYAKALPEGQRSERRITALEKKLASIE